MPRLGPVDLLIANLRRTFPEGAIGYMPQEEAHRKLIQLAGKDFGPDPKKWDVWHRARKAQERGQRRKVTTLKEVAKALRERRNGSG